MAIYTKRKGLNDSTIFWRDKRPVKTLDVPSNIVDLLEHQDKVDDENLKLESPYRRCVFDGEYTKLYRIVNQQPVYICQEDFHEKTLGQIAQRVRENADTLHGTPDSVT